MSKHDVQNSYEYKWNGKVWFCRPAEGTLAREEMGTSWLGYGDTKSQAREECDYTINKVRGYRVRKAREQAI